LFFSSRRRHTRSYGDWSSDVCSSDLAGEGTVGLTGNVNRFIGASALNCQARGVVVIRGTELLHPDLIAVGVVLGHPDVGSPSGRSEERRVGKECRFRCLVFYYVVIVN